MKIEAICSLIRDNVNSVVKRDFGMEVTDLGVNRIGLPENVSKSVITAMSEERSKEISKYQAEGQAIAEAIVSRASSAKEKILAFAQRKAGDIRTQGETKAAESYAKFNADPEFSMFLRSVESLRASLKDRSVFLLDAQTLPVLEWLKTQPTLDSFKEQKKTK
jgi:membrane protease subunit HflC